MMQISIILPTLESLFVINTRLRHLAPAVTTGRKEEMLSHFSSGVRMHPIGADASG